LNPNRISRFIATSSGKRMDFEFTVRRRRYMLEVRGTTGEYTQKKMIGEVEPKKLSASSRGYAAHAGAVTLYSQGSRRDHVALVDPPAGGGEATPLDELAAVLSYYHNVYRLTHTADAFCQDLAAWLARYEAGESPSGPPAPSRRANPRPRVSIEHEGVGRIRGTVYDARLSAAAIARFGTFAEATEATPTPTCVVGTRPGLDEIISRGDWSQLSEYGGGSTHENEDDDNSLTSLLRSGVAVVPIQLSRDETAVASSQFALLRRLYERGSSDEG
jgi:hypothetical protein